jgi:HlyD family secretion protein
VTTIAAGSFAPWLKRERKWLFVVVPAIVLGLLALLGLHRNNQPQYFTAQVERGEIRDVVEATGTVNAVITVQVGSQVSGRVAKLNVDFNSRVHRGEVIALIDPALFDGALLQAVADSEDAEANVAAARANLEKARANFAQANADYVRTEGLAKNDIVTQQQLELAKAANGAAKASVDAAAANVGQAAAQLNQKAAAVSVARTNLNYTVIRSPIDGIVVARNVDVGQTVAASLQAPTLFTIAQDLTKMQVYAKVDESDVGRIRMRQPVTFKVDAFPKQLFRGEVTQIRMNPTMVQNVVTYDAIIEFANPELKLFPGMTAYVTIPVASAQNVLKLPNAALRYKPPLDPDEIRALYRKYGIEFGSHPSRGAGGAAGPEGAGSGEGAAGGSGTDRKTAGTRDAPTDSAIVWTLRAGNTIVPVKVALGITDHAFTEVTGLVTGQLKEGDAVVTRSVTSRTGGPTGQGIRR